MKYLLAGVCLLTACNSQLMVGSDSLIWSINSLTSIAGLPTQVEGNPQLISATTSVSFDGEGDRLLVDNNPLQGAKEFTVEIIFKPRGVFPNNWEPRIFHIESEDNPNRRLTIELRLNDQQQWYLDTFIKSDHSNLTLIDATKVHPVGEWVHAAITYKNQNFVSYVNGKKELEGAVEYLPIPENAKTSIGARMNKIHWFNGEIKTVKITHRVLAPESFMDLK